MSGSVNDIRISTLPRRFDIGGVIIIGYIENGVPVGVDPVALRGTADEIGAVTDAELAAGLAGKQDIAQRGLANGYAPLDANGRVPTVNLPASAGGGAAVTNIPPANLGPTALVGTSLDAARGDHVHPLPTPDQIGAAPISHSHTIGAVLGLQNELDAREAKSNRGQINGYAPLGSDGKVPSAHLPPGIDASALDLKANTSDLVSGLALKADLTYVNTELDTKAESNDSRIVNAVQPDHKATIETIAANYTAVANDANKIKRCTSSTQITVTLPTGLAIGTTIRFVQDAAGAMVFAAGASATVGSFGNYLTSAGIHANIIATVIDTNRWNISGNLS